MDPLSCGNGDHGFPFSYECRDPAPHNHVILGTLGPQSPEIRDPLVSLVNIGGPLLCSIKEYCTGTIILKEVHALYVRSNCCLYSILVVVPVSQFKVSPPPPGQLKQPRIIELC